jgi:hypothetical protein
VTFFQITHAERAGWQRRSAAELAAILHTHRDLPVIAWTVGPAGATLTGRINGLAPAEQVRVTFDAWRAALSLGEHTETPSGPGIACLRAETHRNRVRVGLTATVFDDENGQVQR